MRAWGLVEFLFWQKFERFDNPCAQSLAGDLVDVNRWKESREQMKMKYNESKILLLNQTKLYYKVWPLPLLVHPDAQAPFVPERPDNLVVPMDATGVPIYCRVSDPYSHVILRSVPSGEEMSAYYDNKMGFFGSLSPGQYQCETTVNGQTFKSAIYTVETEGKSGPKCRKRLCRV